MKALIKAEPKVGIHLGEVPKPTPSPDEVLIRLKRTAICGTDVHIYQWDAWSQKTLKLPLIIGHEFCGVIEEMGSMVRGLQIGDRVSGEGHVTCGDCRNCRAGRRHLCRKTLGIGVQRSGAFAEYMTLPAINVFKLPDSISDDLAAIFDPFGNALHSALSFDLAGEDILITGAGPVGLMAAAVARHVGARHVVITDVNPYRLELAKTLGATRTVLAQKEALSEVMQQLHMTEGFDVGLEMSGQPQAFQGLLKAMNHGGRVALLGIFPEAVSIDWDLVIFKGLILKGIYGREIFETWYKMAALLQGGLNLAPVITHRLPIDRYEEGFQAMRSGLSGKIVLNWES